MRPFALLLVGLALVASACSQDLGSHDHGDDEASHDHGDDHAAGQEAGYDHHGNPLSEELFYRDVTVDGTRVEFTIQTFLGVGGRGGHVVTDVAAGAHAAAVIHVTDAESGDPVTPDGMLGWVGTSDGESCTNTVEGFVSGSLTRSPVIDLSAFFVLALNRESGISVIDPSVDVAGMTQLFTVIPLIAPGADWAITPGARFAAVAIPATAQVAVVDLEAFETMAHLDVGGTPVSVVADPTRERAWVAGTGPGVSVIDLPDFAVAFEIETGDAVPTIAVTETAAFVASGSDLMVLDTGSGVRRALVRVEGGEITALAAAAGTAWIATDAAIEARDSDGGQLWHQPADRVAGLWSVDDGSVVVAAAGSRAVFLDAVTGETLADIDAGGAVTDVVDAFGEIVLAVPERDVLIRFDPDRIGQEGGTTIVELGTTGMAPTISIAEDRGAIVVAVPGQDQVQLIPAGSTSPAGAFQGHGLIPTATATIDRSFVATAPGVYTARFRAPDPGSYRLALLMQGPQVVECFEFEVAAPAVSSSPPAPDVSLVEVAGERAGEPTTVTISVGGDGGHDVEFMVVATAGAWQQRMEAEPTGLGRYAASMTLPVGGVYQLFVRIPGLGLDFGALPNFYLDVDAS